MSRTTERARSTFYRAGGMPRVASMILLLLVIGMLIGRSADPRTWAWLTREGEAPAEPLPSSASARREPRPPERHPPEPITPGPTDQFADEREAAAEEFQAITDGTLGMAKEEMPAYWRMFQWVEHQSLAELMSRSDKTALLNHFMQRPDEQRGRPFQLELNVRRVLSYPAPPNSAGIDKVYEVTGWTTESKAWLYVVLTAHLPEGMPTGPDVTERVTFAGYFLKLQGYHEAGAGPRDKPLSAPLLVGRMSWQPTPAPAKSSFAGDYWEYWPVAIAFLLGVGAVGWWLMTPGQSWTAPTTSLAQQRSPASGALNDWLARAERGQMNSTADTADTRFQDN